LELADKAEKMETLAFDTERGLRSEDRTRERRR
jgi:hypothetical protein